MKAAEIKVGGIYWANVSGKKVRVQVEDIYQRSGLNTGNQRTRLKAQTYYMVTNLATGRTLMFRSAKRFLGSVADAEAGCQKVVAAVEQATIGSIPTRPRGNPDCSTCDGYGYVVTHTQLPDGSYTDSSESPCPECMVAGRGMP
jgi:DnaJ-class molecular chaperone